MVVEVIKVSMMLIKMRKASGPNCKCHCGKMVRMYVFRTAALSHPLVWYF